MREGGQAHEENGAVDRSKQAESLLCLSKYLFFILLKATRNLEFLNKKMAELNVTHKDHSDCWESGLTDDNTCRESSSGSYCRDSGDK